MTTALPEPLRSLYGRWARGDFRSDRGAFTNDVVVEPWSAAPRQSYAREGIATWCRGYLSGWRDLRVEAVDWLEGERGIAVTERLSGFDLGAGARAEMRLYSAWSFTGDRVARVRWEIDRLKAYELAGVSQQSPEWNAGWSASAGLPFDDADLESRIVWIWGSPRSGSTWLLRQLSDPAVPDRRAPLGFTVRRGNAAKVEVVPYDEFLISTHVAPKLGPPAPFGGSYLPRTLPGFAADHTTYSLAQRYVDIWQPELRRLVLVRLAATIDRARLAGIGLDHSILLMIKEVNGSHAATDVMRMFPRSRFLFLIRDGRDVIDSLIHAYEPGGWMHRHGPGLRGPQDRENFLREAATEWACNVDVVRSAFDAHEPGLRLAVRYEDLRADPAAGLTELRRWLGLDDDPERVAQIVSEHHFDSIPADERGPAQVTRAARPGLWREHLSEEELAQVNEIMGSQLARLGYVVA